LEEKWGGNDEKGVRIGGGEWRLETRSGETGGAGGGYVQRGGDWGGGGDRGIKDGRGGG